MSSTRLTKLNQQLKRVLSEALQQYPARQPGLLATVVSVEVAADISSAVVWLSLLGNESVAEVFLQQLEDNKRYFAEYMHHHFEAKRQPRLIFRRSRSLEHLQNIA